MYKNQKTKAFQRDFNSHSRKDADNQTFPRRKEGKGNMEY